MAQRPPQVAGPDALVVACSDYRWGQALETFCRKELALDRWDAVMVPGGVYLLSYPGALPQNYRVGSRMLEFLVKGHLPPLVVLIGHEGCQRYRQGLSLPPGRTLKEQQQDDLRKVAQWLRDRFPAVEVRAYYAAGDPQDGPSFEALVR